MIKGIVFDCDGTLADTMPLHWIAWSTIVKRHQLNFSEKRFYELGGVPSRDILKMLSEEQGIPIDHLAVALEKEDAYLPLLPQVQPVHEVVAIARENAGKIPMAVASGGVKTIIEQVLVHLGIRELFQAVVTSEDVTRQKPAPDIFLEAARRIGVEPQFCRGYEDTDLGDDGDSGGGDGGRGCSAHAEARDVGGGVRSLARMRRAHWACFAAYSWGKTIDVEAGLLLDSLYEWTRRREHLLIL